MINFFQFEKCNSYRDLNAFVKEKDAHSAPSPDLTFLQIPGKSGDMIIDNGRLSNVPAKYLCTFIVPKGETFASAAGNIRAALLSQGTGYKKLYDSYDADYFRYGAIDSAIEVEQIGKEDGEFTVKFNCKPYRYSYAGQRKTKLTVQGSIYNYEKFNSEPYIKVFGDGNISITINGVAFEVADVQGFVEIDSEQMNVFKGDINMNGKTNTLNFPIFQPKNNIISWNGNVRYLEIVPRWRTV